MSLGAPIIINNSTKVCSGLVIFLHGSGDTGQGFLNWIKFLVGDNFPLPHIKYYFPTAPLRPYTPLHGELSNVWFDRYNITPDVPEHTETLQEIGVQVQHLIQNAMASERLDLNKIVIGGFSMGDALALHEAYRYSPGLGGVFTISSFLNNDTILYKEVKSPETPLCMFHGDRDTLVPLSWGKNTYNELTKMGISADFHTVKHTLHELKKSELKSLFDWIQQILPPLDK